VGYGKGDWSKDMNWRRHRGRPASTSLDSIAHKNRWRPPLHQSSTRGGTISRLRPKTNGKLVIMTPAGWRSPRCCQGCWTRRFGGSCSKGLNRGSAKAHEEHEARRTRSTKNTKHEDTRNAELRLTMSKTTHCKCRTGCDSRRCACRKNNEACDASCGCTD
jgi:hypothetical protein